MKKIFLSLIGVLVVSIFANDMSVVRCMGCHGKVFEKSAMGKSKIVKDMNSTEISSALIGYQNGSYGGVMKGLMKGQVSKYSKDEIEQITKIIIDINSSK